MAEIENFDKSAVAATEGENRVSPIKKSWDDMTKDMFESFWLFPEDHPARLGYHITIRGIFAGTTSTAVVGLPILLYRKKTPLAASLGRMVLRGGIWGGAMLAVVAAERLYRLEKEGVEDRSYRLAYNWGQNRWDLLALDGAIACGLLLRRPFGGILPAAAMGTVLGTMVAAGIGLAQKKK